ncbi:MFS transporter [Saccharopolyspora sp. K220]|uniref:MFS transporter n=1 Tax=Saccharopolyspora soli TaxID=2926618 RepID=UPI001F584906|nr:MFS transporter [Saccharopolyspora soli]MCI2423849.1 MFS transporter [Saccharopolyspora soli]
MTWRISPAGKAGKVGGLMAALLAACIAYQLNASMFSPVLATMAQELQTTDSAIALSQTIFFTVAALFSLFLPRLSDIVGRRRVLIWALVAMTVGTVLGAIAPSVEILQLARGLQGVSGTIIPVCLLMLQAEVSDRKRSGVLMGILAAVNGGIAGIDVIFGGLLATYFGFRSVFWVIAVVTVVAVVLVLVATSESRPTPDTTMDWVGVVPLTMAVAALLVALNNAQDVRSANWIFIAGCAVFGVVAFAVFHGVEKRRRYPLITPTRMRERSTWALLLTTVLTLTGVYAAAYGVIASFAQDADVGFGLAADATSVVLLMPFAVAGWVVGPFAGKLGPIVGYGQVMRGGLIGCIVALVGVATLGLHSLSALIICTIILGVAYVGVANIMLNALGVLLSPKDAPGSLPGLNAGAFNLGAGLGFSVLTAVQVAWSPASGSSSDGYFYAILAGIAITAVALAVSFLIPTPADEAETDATTRDDALPVDGQPTRRDSHS